MERESRIGVASENKRESGQRKWRDGGSSEGKQIKWNEQVQRESTQKLVERGSGEITMRKWRQKVEERKQNEKVVSSKQRLGGVELERKVE